jgi:integrase
LSGILIRGTVYDTIEGVIAAYVGTNKDGPLPADVEARLREQVRVTKPKSLTGAQNLIRVNFQFHFACRTLDIPLEAGRLFTNKNIEWFCAKYLATHVPANRSMLRGCLRRIARAVSTTHGIPARGEEFERRPLKEPVSDEVIAGYRSIVPLQPTAYRQRNLKAMLCLAAGAGLRSVECVLVTGRHVRTESGFVLIDVEGDHPRSVPVRREYESDLLALAAAHPDEPLLGSNPRATRAPMADWMSRLTIPDWLPPMNIARLRSHWMLTYLSANVNIPSFLYFAGVNDIRVREWTDFFPDTANPTADRSVFAGDIT